jgi:FtsH-binding integral membrane protein
MIMANFPSNNAAFPGTGVDSRATFITRTYTHVVGGILGFILVELGLFESGLAVQIAHFMLGFNWLLILGAFMLTSWLATRTAQTSSSIGMQYFSYAIYVVAQALIFVPLLYIADAKAPGTIDSAVLVTALGAGGLMFVAHRTRKDFSFLRAILMWGGVLALIAIIGGVVFGFQVLGADDRLRRRSGSLRYLEHHSSLSGRPLCLGGDAAVRIDCPDVLVRVAALDGQPQLIEASRQQHLRAHVGAESGRYLDAAVRLLTVLEDRHQRSSDREARTVQGMHRLRFAGGRITPAGLHPARLVRLKITAGRNLAIALL